MKQTLLIIDMQEEFEAACGSRIIQGCSREISEAMNRGDAILFVEYDMSPRVPTLPALTRLTKGYRNKFSVKKKGDDGSREVVGKVWDHDLPTAFRVCGVNSDCCVWDTVYSLRELMPTDTPIVLVADALSLEDYDGEEARLYRLLKDLKGWKENGFRVVHENKLKRAG